MSYLVSSNYFPGISTIFQNWASVGDRGVLTAASTYDNTVEIRYFRPSDNDPLGPLIQADFITIPLPDAALQTSWTIRPDDALGIPGEGLAVFLVDIALGNSSPSVMAVCVRVDGMSIAASATIVLLSTGYNLDPSEPYTLSPGMDSAQVRNDWGVSRAAVTQTGDPARVRLTVQLVEGQTSGSDNLFFFAEREFEVRRSGSGVTIAPVWASWRKIPENSTFSSETNSTFMDASGRVWLPTSQGMLSYGLAPVPLPESSFNGVFWATSRMVAGAWSDVGPDTDYVWASSFLGGGFGSTRKSYLATVENDPLYPGTTFFTSTGNPHEMRGEVQSQVAMILRSSPDIGGSKLLVVNDKGQYEVCPQLIPTKNGLNTVPDHLAAPKATTFSVTPNPSGGIDIVRVVLTPVGVAPPLRSLQRDDGAGLRGHARLQTQGIARRSNSQQSGVRLGTNNTYL